MSSVTFYKICELLLVVIYAFGADYMMTSCLDDDLSRKERFRSLIFNGWHTY